MCCRDKRESERSVSLHHNGRESIRAGVTGPSARTFIDPNATNRISMQIVFRTSPRPNLMLGIAFHCRPGEGRQAWSD